MEISRSQLSLFEVKPSKPLIHCGKGMKTKRTSIEVLFVICLGEQDATDLFLESG